jgi:hypothetical protein
MTFRRKRLNSSRLILNLSTPGMGTKTKEVRMAGILRELRDLVPIRGLNQTEAFRIAELQANRLLERAGIKSPPVRGRVIEDLPRIQVERVTPNFASGATQWSHGRWLIVLAASETRDRQRFTLAHEFKHIIDNPFIASLYPDAYGIPSHERAEQVCNYFAASLLVPRNWLQDLYREAGIHDARALSRIFRVSLPAMQIRLMQLGMVRPSADKYNGSSSVF